MSDVELYFACIPGWVDMYVEGYWTAEEFIAHLDAMMPRADLLHP